MKYPIWLALVLLGLGCRAGNSLERAFQERCEQFQGERERPIGELILALAASYLGTPYEGHTLEQPGEEKLVVYFAGFDCFTFLEHVLAMARVLKSGRPDFGRYREELARIRYRAGVLDGYPSRLHYTSDWGFDNGEKGVLRDVTAELGGVPLQKRINFMSTHRDSYRQLADDAFFSEIQAIEARLNEREYFYIPKARVAEMEDGIRDGDLLAITSGVKGLDIAHVGFAIRKKGGRLHMLHASSTHKQVEITAQPLADYLAAIRSQTGIMVYRPLEP